MKKLILAAIVSSTSAQATTVSIRPMVSSSCEIENCVAGEFRKVGEEVQVSIPQFLYDVVTKAHNEVTPPLAVNQTQRTFGKLRSALLLDALMFASKRRDQQEASSELFMIASAYHSFESQVGFFHNPSSVSLVPTFTPAQETFVGLYMSIMSQE